jgi:hypothetical protein
MKHGEPFSYNSNSPDRTLAPSHPALNWVWMIAMTFCCGMSTDFIGDQGAVLTGKSYSEGIGMIQPRASSNFTGACAHVKRISSVTEFS